MFELLVVLENSLGKVFVRLFKYTKLFMKLSLRFVSIMEDCKSSLYLGVLVSHVLGSLDLLFLENLEFLDVGLKGFELVLHHSFIADDFVLQLVRQRTHAFVVLGQVLQRVCLGGYLLDHLRVELSLHLGEVVVAQLLQLQQGLLVQFLESLDPLLEQLD